MTRLNPHGPDFSRDTLALVLAGGNGTRLGELTRWQCKPAVSFGGHFRNIDFTLSNCVNSGVRRIGVLTQYKAQSLITHLAGGWNFLPRVLGEFVDIWPAQQRVQASWYAGTADAVYQNLDLIQAQGARYTLVLAGDHIYKMDYRRLLERHVASGAPVTVGCVPVPVEEAGSFGVLGVDSHARVRSFSEKPHPGTLNIGAQSSVLASMGIYVFNTEYLIETVIRDAALEASARDFGRDILPAAVREDRVAAFLFMDGDGHAQYWRDVGTLDAYWQAHMELLLPEPPIDLYDAAWPVLTLPEQLPPARLLAGSTRHGTVTNSLLAGGVVVRGANVSNSVLATNVHVADGSELNEAVVLPGAHIGANCRLHRVIVDSGVHVPDGTVAGYAEALDTSHAVPRARLLSHSYREELECVSRDDRHGPGHDNTVDLVRSRQGPGWLSVA
jgi:glucose-1-phosphate adenylyltransferase